MFPPDRNLTTASDPSRGQSKRQYHQLVKVTEWMITHQVSCLFPQLSFTTNNFNVQMPIRSNYTEPCSRGVKRVPIPTLKMLRWETRAKRSPRHFPLRLERKDSLAYLMLTASLVTRTRKKVAKGSWEVRKRPHFSEPNEGRQIELQLTGCLICVREWDKRPGSHFWQPRVKTINNW